MKIKIDCRCVRYVPSISTTSKVFIDKKRKSMNRRVLNDKRNWE